MHRLFRLWICGCVVAGLAACGMATPPPIDRPVLEKPTQASPSATADDPAEPDKADDQPEIEVTVQAPEPVAPPIPKPSIAPTITINPKPEDGSEATQDSTPDDPAVPEVADNETSDKPFTDQNTDEIINNIIWKIQSEVARKPPEPEPVIPEGQDPSLASDALEAAFALLAEESKPDSSPMIAREWSAPKAKGVTRVALLLPLTGTYGAMGTELRRGAELALFSSGNPAIELLVFDTSGGTSARQAAEEAVAAESDIIIGPLFSESVRQARLVAQDAGIPMLLLSNNAVVASRGNWLMGYLPEQQLDLLLGHAVADGRKNFAIIAEDSPFGRRLVNHAQRRLRDLGLATQDTLVLRKDVLDNEDLLKRTIRSFARYVVDDETAQTKPPVFDALVFAGGADFALRSAPVLAYYDLGSDSVMYLGNEQWNQPHILSEPSLQGALFANRPSSTDTQFAMKWRAVWPDRPGFLARLSFDAVALAEVLAGQDRTAWQKALLSDVGFKGFSGAFRFLPEGVNIRAFEMRQISDGNSILLKPAPDRI